jgi:ribose 5-phosphate isomerase B
MRFAAASDHAGRALRAALVAHLRAQGHSVEDFGTHGDASCDYPDFAVAVGRAVASGAAERGLLVCGTGIGMAMAANKVPGVRAAVLSEPTSARATRAHNDANVLCLGERIVGVGVATDILDAFTDTAFEGGRHARRVALLDSLLPPAGA